VDEEYEYDLDCNVCDSVMTLIVREGNDEQPQACPMCGTVYDGGEWR